MVNFKSEFLMTKQDNERIISLLKELEDKVPDNSLINSILFQNNNLLCLSINVISKRHFKMDLEIDAKDIDQIVSISKDLIKKELSIWHKTRFIS